ncbi:MAG TPA: DNA methyltransferase [Thermodesulfobacteriota bacterium]|nr:DNA methyltransferase [Thermodesulfobacteriota bacterium]
MADSKRNVNSIKYAIEDSFPIVEINRLAIPERNAFKPIYKMHKWFARRASCVFRAILLGCMKPVPLDENGNPIKSGAEVIMEEFYKDHTNDPDTKGKVVLDPFMGGGTTVVEALRLGCKVIGIDLNPVAWFIVKTEVKPVDIDELKASFERLAERKVVWNGKLVKQTLLERYKTECPCCGAGRVEADIIYTFWVKSAICTNPLCKKEVPLFSDYIIAAKSPSIRYNRDVECPECKKTFDWEIEPASLIAEPGLCIVSPSYSAGSGRTSARWAFSANDKVECPWCKKIVKAQIKHPKAERKKVSLTVLLCPHYYSVWQWRGNLPDEVSCPVCKKDYNPVVGNIPRSGWFLCPSCGHTDRIINSIRNLPKDQLLPLRPYAIEGYCSFCAGDIEEEVESPQLTLDGANSKIEIKKTKLTDHICQLTKNNGKFFKRITPSDLARYQKACEMWEKEKGNLPYPRQKIPDGQETHRLLEHHYHYWHQMFNPRQLLCLSLLLKAIDEEPNQVLKEMLLSAFQGSLESNNTFCRYTIAGGNKSQGIFSRHDFQPKLTFTENNPWGTEYGHATFYNKFELIVEGKKWAFVTSDRCFTGRFSKEGKPILEDVQSGEAVYSTEKQVFLMAGDSKSLGSLIQDGEAHFVVTDPPYASNVNYSELADFFYVWLRLSLSKTYPYFAPELTPKVQEIIVNPTRGHTEEDFKLGLQAVFEECRRKLLQNGLLLFTFHHSEGKAWEALLEAVCEAGFEIDSVYPIQGEAETSLHLLEKEAIAYDLIHVCRKRKVEQEIKKRSWAGIRQEIRRRSREEIKAIEAGRYGQELSPADVNIVLIGKCLELYSRHYGAVVDHEGKEVTLKQALEEIRMMVDQLLTREQPLPSELSDIDPESYVYLTSLCDRKEVKSDDVHKATRGILEPESLIKAGIMIKGRAGRGRTHEVKQPSERFNSLLEKFKETPLPQQDLFGEIEAPKMKGNIYFIDYIHFLMALVEGGENIIPWLEGFRGETPRLRAACEYLMARNRSFTPTLKKIIDLIEVGPLFQTR